MKNNAEFILNTYFSDFVKVIKVNNNTGEFQFLRRFDAERSPEALGITTISEYMEKIVVKQLCTPDAIEKMLYDITPGCLNRLAERGEYRTTHTEVYHIADRYFWLTCLVSLPKDFSEQNPWYLITWKPTDSETEAMAESMVIFSTCFYKVLKVNLTTDYYEIVKVIDEELNNDVISTNRITDWWDLFVRQGYVKEEDVPHYQRFTDISWMRRQLKREAKPLRCRYRRKTLDEYRWVSMEIVPALEYTNENQIVMLYIRDINDDYVDEVIYQQELEHLCYHDGATGLRNRMYYNRLCDRYDDGCENAVGVIFADLNRLKYINDNFGHAQGDRYIEDFALFLASQFGVECSYRLSGDEFVVVLEKISEDDFHVRVQDIHNKISRMDVPTASIGSAYKTIGKKKLDDIARDAELDMYNDKRDFYKRFAEYERKKSVST